MEHIDLPQGARAWRKKKGRGNFLSCRYADDFVVLCDGTKEHAEAMRQLLEFLAAELKLTLSMEKTRFRPRGRRVQVPRILDREERGEIGKAYATDTSASGSGHEV